MPAAGLQPDLAVDAPGVRLRHARTGRAGRSTPDAQPLDQALVAAFVDTLDVIEQLAALRHELEQAAPGVVVLDVGLEMLGQGGDALGQERDLDLRRAGVARG